MNIENIYEILDEMCQDRTVPRNVRTSLESIKTTLKNEKLDMPVKINTAISTLDEVSNDPNIPIYSRTQIWNVVSMLEVMNEQIKTHA